VLARNPSNYDGVVDEINSSGGQALGISADVSDVASVQSAFEKISQQYKDMPLAAAVFNSGGGFVRKPFLELTEEEFAAGFKSQGCAFPHPIFNRFVYRIESYTDDEHRLGAFNFAKATLPLLQKATGLQHPPTLIFTGATASVKGSANFSAFATGKFALRALAQSLAREFGPKGVHISHVIIDGVIDIPRTKGWANEHEDGKLDPGAVSTHQCRLCIDAGY
jgi:NAD(P)-dependent dehydrogenase (short-subunit alcohol dehydrogenase family)